MFSLVEQRDLSAKESLANTVKPLDSRQMSLFAERRFDKSVCSFKNSRSAYRKSNRVLKFGGCLIARRFQTDFRFRKAQDRTQLNRSGSRKLRILKFKILAINFTLGDPYIHYAMSNSLVNNYFFPPRFSRCAIAKKRLPSFQN